MEHAYTDLITTDYPIHEISEKNGFASYAFLSGNSKRLTGPLP
ncbi:MAG: hypothetical protein ACLR2E_22830 [Lachnospiraceae bacterium]